MKSRSSVSQGQVSCGDWVKRDRRHFRALDRTGGLVQAVRNGFCRIAPLRRERPGSGVPDRAGDWFEWRQVAQTWENTNENELNGWAIAVRSLPLIFGGPNVDSVKNSTLMGL